ncbi:unnamed protein product [Arctogadus glacialis]
MLSLLTWEKDLPVDLKPPPHSVHGLASNASTASSNASSTASSSTEGEVDMPSAIGPTSVSGSVMFAPEMLAARVLRST